MQAVRGASLPSLTQHERWPLQHEKRRSALCLAVLGGGGEKTRSRIAVYCSPACQRAAWPSHKRLCKALKGERAEGQGFGVKGWEGAL